MSTSPSNKIIAINLFIFVLIHKNYDLIKGHCHMPTIVKLMLQALALSHPPTLIQLIVEYIYGKCGPLDIATIYGQQWLVKKSNQRQLVLFTCRRFDDKFFLPLHSWASVCVARPQGASL